jgi:hypothetical protein
LLVRDYELLLEYIEPDAANLGAFSHRTYELLLRSCTEFESLAKGAAVERGLIAPGSSPSIPGLSGLVAALDLASIEVLALRWTPTPLATQPLNGWDRTPHGLSWYKAYNDVKHNRSDKFPEASIRHVTTAIGACFSLLLSLRAIKVPIERHIHLPANRLEIDFPDLQLAIRIADNWHAIT